ncbi:MAG: AmmeMemoRadiSam system protein A [Ignavibacteriae bacterium]|nr:AmmeMemoRadiSam system protein A [Ignavibacteriota bacterium]NOG99066.1 AmmeMemoRadiSam system protein A [Ignavibacteriota bacterium]
MELTKEEKLILLKTARNSIGSLFGKTEKFKPNTKMHPVFNSNAGAFVTLTINRKLRGCIGYIISDKPLLQTIKDAAIQAAQADPRFSPLTYDELEKIEIELSILSEPFLLSSYDEIIIGKHGLILDEPGSRGLLLPQVPIEHNMNRDEFLSAICQKSGLHDDYWKETQLNLSGFTATVFNENEMEG